MQCYLIVLRTKYFPGHFVSKCLYFAFFSKCKRPRFIVYVCVCVLLRMACVTGDENSPSFHQSASSSPVLEVRGLSGRSSRFMLSSVKSIKLY
jgi:hypothetical protein